MNTQIEQLEAFLDKEVRPALAKHNGNVIIKSLSDGVLRVTLTGQCAGCPSAHTTNESLISEPVIQAFPDIKDVILVEETSQELMDFAWKILNS